MSVQVDKKTRMQNMFQELSMNNTQHFEGIVLDPNSHIKDGSGMATHTLLTQILEKNDFPCLVLEDDAKNTEWFKHEYQLPDECDALYLGVSKAGARGAGALATVYSNDYYRVWNMLATHAVVYFSKSYVEKLLHRGFVYLHRNIPYDIAIAEIHNSFKILTPTFPSFYQYDPDKNSKYDVEFYTKNPLQPLDSHIKEIEFDPQSLIMKI